MVGAERLELTTSWSQTRRSSQLSYAPNTHTIPAHPIKIPSPFEGRGKGEGK